MGDSDLYTSRELLEKIQTRKEIANIIDSSAMQDVIRVTGGSEIQNLYQITDIAKECFASMAVIPDFSGMAEMMANCCKMLVPENYNDQLKQISFHIQEMAQQIMPLYSHDQLISTVDIIKGIAENYSLLYYNNDNESDEEVVENEEISNKIVREIFALDGKSKKSMDEKETAIITLSPVNEKVLKYLAENPDVLYQLEDREFEIVMAEIYSKLGYKVEITKATRDGGKDIIIRKPEILGDFVYYVECKKYAAKRHIGVGIVRQLVGTVLTDKVNGGILATTSYFSPDAKRFIVDNKYDYQIQMHDYDVIRNMLNKVI